MRKMRKNEVRCFKISGNAINELLWELLNINGDMLLDIPEKSDVIFHMNWDKEKDELIFSALEFAQPHPVDFKAIDFYRSFLLLIISHIKVFLFPRKNKQTYGYCSKISSDRLMRFILFESVKEFWE